MNGKFSLLFACLQQSLKINRVKILSFMMEVIIIHVIVYVYISICEETDKICFIDV